MPTGRLTMRRIRDVLRLGFAQGLSERAIAASLGLGKGSVGTYLRRARDAGLAWPLPEALDDDSLELLLFPNASDVSDPDRPVPDWAAVDKELRRRSVTRMLLWQEYRAQHPNGFGYTWFCTHFEAWKGRVRPSMRQTHVGGEKVFIDFAGDTIAIVDPGTGEVSNPNVHARPLQRSHLSTGRKDDEDHHVLPTPYCSGGHVQVAATVRAGRASSAAMIKRWMSLVPS